MAQISREEKTALFYIRFITVGQVISEFKTSVIAWAVVSVLFTAFGIAFGTAGEFVFRSVTVQGKTLNDVPVWCWYMIVVAFVTWVARGRSLTIPIPNFRFRGWLLFNVVVGAFMLAAVMLPGWAFMPVYIGVLMFCGLLDELGELGKKNYESLQLDRD